MYNWMIAGLPARACLTVRNADLIDAIALGYTLIAEGCANVNDRVQMAHRLREFGDLPTTSQAYKQAAIACPAEADAPRQFSSFLHPVDRPAEANTPLLRAACLAPGDTDLHVKIEGFGLAPEERGRLIIPALAQEAAAGGGQGSRPVRGPSEFCFMVAVTGCQGGRLEVDEARYQWALDCSALAVSPHAVHVIFSWTKHGASMAFIWEAWSSARFSRIIPISPDGSLFLVGLSKMSAFRSPRSKHSARPCCFTRSVAQRGSFGALQMNTL